MMFISLSRFHNYLAKSWLSERNFRNQQRNVFLLKGKTILTSSCPGARNSNLRGISGRKATSLHGSGSGWHSLTTTGKLDFLLSIGTNDVDSVCIGK